MVSRHSLGELQHAIMKVLWSRGEAAVTDVHQALQDRRRLAPTTVATMLRKMEDKGVVAHRLLGRQFLYRPIVSESQVRRTMVGELLEQLFDGDSAALVAHLVSEHEIDAAERRELEKRLAPKGRG